MCPDKIVNGHRHTQFPVVKDLRHKGRNLSVLVLESGKRVMVSQTVTQGWEVCIAELLDESLSNQQIKDMLDAGVDTTEIFTIHGIFTGDIERIAEELRSLDKE